MDVTAQSAEAVIRNTIESTSPMIGGVEVRRTEHGWVTSVLLNPVLVRCRADQQGLRDPSIEAAAAPPRLQRQIAHIIDVANGGLPREQRVVDHVIDVRPGHAR